MTDIPTNALRQHLAEILRRVAAGESFRVTRRGRALAVLSPPGGDVLRLSKVHIGVGTRITAGVPEEDGGVVHTYTIGGEAEQTPEEEFALLERLRRDAIPLGEFGTSAYFRAQDRDRETYRERYREWLASREPTFHDGGYVDRDGKAALSNDHVVSHAASASIGPARPPCDPGAVRALGPCPACPNEDRCLSLAGVKQ